MPKISLFKDIWETKNGDTITLDDFLERIRDGYWQDYVLPIRAIQDDEKRKEAKKKVPYVTIGGEFKERIDAGLVKHSGFIAIDIDKIDPEETKSIINCDKHVYATFTSISGKGLCVLFKINPSKHREAHAGIGEYLYNQYGMIIDTTSVNESRARLVSFDPYIFINKHAEKWSHYVKEKPIERRVVIFSPSDFNDILNEIQRRGANLVESYHDWIRIGFGFAENFGEQGRDYFHAISRQSSKYNTKQCDKQYDNCIAGSRSSGKRSHIATFYYCCKQHGIETYSERTKTIAQAAEIGKKSGKTKEEVIAQVSEDPDCIVEQIYNANETTPIDDSFFGQIEQWLRSNYELRRNIITRYIESSKIVMKQKDYNTIYVAGSKAIPKLKYENIERLINSDFTPDYNPILEFIQKYEHVRPVGLIDALFDTIETEDDKKIFSRLIGKKWLVSIMSSIHGIHSPLMLVLSGDVQGTGKTEFLRRLLPDELRPYYAESKLDAGKDDEILMTQKLLIMDDEMGGKSKKDERRLKELLSRQVFSLREPYGRNNVDLNRLAVLCGTTNDRHILNDPTGNRRILPIHVISINQESYNKIDKTELLIEAYHLYKSGFDWQLSKDEINALGLHGDMFQSYTSEYELLNKYYDLPFEGGTYIELTASDIKVQLERFSMQKLSLDKIGKELNRIGYQQFIKKKDGKTKRVYQVIEVTPSGEVTPNKNSGVTNGTQYWKDL